MFNRKEAICIDFFWSNNEEYDFFVENFLHFHEFNYIGISSDNYSGKLVNLDKGLELLKRQRIKDIDGITFLYAPPESRSPTYDWIVYVVYAKSGIKQRLSLYYDYSLNLKLNIANFMMETLKRYGFKYAYYHRLPFNFGPEYYSVGMLYGSDLQKEEEKQLSKWFNYILTDNEDRIRDFFLINIFNHNQMKWLNSKGVTFEEYINKKNELECISINQETFMVKLLFPEKLYDIREEIKKMEFIL